MNRYETSIPRVAFGIAAVAMTAITIGVSVILPAEMDSSSRDAQLLAASKVTPPASMGVDAATSIEVVATHAALVPVRCRLPKSNRNLEG